MTSDPTYDWEAIMAGPRSWRLAFQLSELFNDNAPLGWSLYIPIAEQCLEEARKLITSEGPRP